MTTLKDQIQVSANDTTMVRVPVRGARLSGLSIVGSIAALVAVGAIALIVTRSGEETAATAPAVVQGIAGWELPQMFLPEQTQAVTAQVSAIAGWELPQMFLPEQTQAQYVIAASGPR